MGLGPGDACHMTARTSQLLRDAPVTRLRTRVHPAAESLDAPSYDDWYDQAESFDDLYARIADDLVCLARASSNGEVLYAVPGSPVVAERTVELLRDRDDVEVICEAAVSVIDVACAALGIDPMTRGLRVLDALASNDPLRGPGPLLILQAYAPEVLAMISDRLPASTPVVVLHHLGLADERVVGLLAGQLSSFSSADHLTSLYVAQLRTAGDAMDDLVSFTRRLRAECPWDREQTHRSLARYLLEESYEALDAIGALATMSEELVDDEVVVKHAQEELGDLLFQVLFHAELADEEGRFDLAKVADAEMTKLTGRHPHVFGDVVVESSADVAANWEAIKKEEKGRRSVLDGLAWSAPSLALHAKLLHAARHLDVAPHAREALAQLRSTLGALTLPQGSAHGVDGVDGDRARRELQDSAELLSIVAARLDVDLEGLLRERVVDLRDAVLTAEANGPETSKGAD